MTSEMQDRLDRLEATCARLQTANRRERGVQGVLILGLAGAMALGLTGVRHPAPLQGTDLTIRREDGAMLAWIGQGEWGGEICLYDRGGDVYWSKAAPRQGAPAMPLGDIPAPLTEQQLENMTLQEVQTALANVSKARRLRNLDDETAARLKREFGLLIDRIRELR